ncbi:ATP-dependent helicase, partial [Staphylococcus xylosus]
PPIDVFGLKTTVNEIHDLNEKLFSTMYDIIQASEIQDDEVHKLHFVYHFDVTPILNDLHAIIHKLNMTLEFFNGMSHKSIKSVRKQFLYINDRFKEIEQSLKNNHTSYLSIKNLNQKSTIKLNVKDYGVKEILTKQVLDKFNSLTFISGTLTFNHTFDNFKHWFNKDINFNTYEIDSTVMSQNQTTVFIPNDVTSYNYKNINDYVSSIVNYVIEYVNIIESKCLILFTSYKMMHMVQELLNELPEFEDYVILAQQQNQNYKIVQQFNSFNKAILLGTGTFFEGFDFESNGIKCVMIAKLPFMNQNNTKYWLMESEFTSTFKEYVLPDAVTRFRQGLGRLIRSENDKGIIVSFDDRLIRSNYKQFFEQSLESYRQNKGDIKQFSSILKKLKKDENNR